MSAPTSNVDLSRLFARLEGPELSPLLQELKNLLESSPGPERLTAATAAIRAISASNQRHVQNIHFVFQNALDTILDLCSLDSVARFSQLSIYFRIYVKNYLVRRIHAMLGKWVEKPILFRDALRHTRTVISGSTALAFIVGADWESNDLDLWAPAGRASDMIVTHLRHIEGYTLDNILINGVDVVGGDDDPVALPVAPIGLPYNNARIRSVTKLSKMVFDKSRGFDIPRYIDVIESATDHPIDPILRFHSSVVINWITADSLVVTYPKLTFAMKALINERINVSLPRQRRWQDKYAERGVEFITDTSQLSTGCGAACPAVWRSTKDVGCMEVQLGTEVGVEREGEEEDYPELQWSLSKATDSYVRGRKCYNRLCPRYLMFLRRRDGRRPVQA